MVKVSLSEELLVRPSIPGFWMILPKYLLKIPANLLSSETTLLFSAKAYKVMYVKEGFTVF